MEGTKESPGPRGGAEAFRREGDAEKWREALGHGARGLDTEGGAETRGRGLDTGEGLRHGGRGWDTEMLSNGGVGREVGRVPGERGEQEGTPVFVSTRRRSPVGGAGCSPGGRGTAG